MVRRNRATNPLRQTAFWRAQAFFAFSFLASAESSISDLDFDGSVSRVTTVRFPRVNERGCAGFPSPPPPRGRSLPLHLLRIVATLLKLTVLTVRVAPRRAAVRAVRFI